MQNETGNDTSTLEAEVRNAVEQGHDVQEKVRKLTLRIISARSLDIKSVRQAAGAVLRGARAGVQKELQHSSAQTHIAREDLKRARADLESLEAMFVETLQSSAAAAKDTAGEILHDLAAHTRTHGSAIGTQLKNTLVVFAQQIGAAGRAQAGVGPHLRSEEH